MTITMPELIEISRAALAGEGFAAHEADRALAVVLQDPTAFLKAIRAGFGGAA